MSLHSYFVKESDIDFEKVRQNGGVTPFDGFYAMFECPFCKRIYLSNYDNVDTVIFTDAHDLSKCLTLIGSTFFCASCGKEIEDHQDPTDPEFPVRYEDIKNSDWSWILNEAKPGRGDRHT